MFALRSLLRLCALACVALLAAHAARRRTTATPPALPAWPDQSPSVYSAARTAAAPEQHAAARTDNPSQPHAVRRAARRRTQFVASRRASRREPPTDDSRRLGPRRNRSLARTQQTQTSRRRGASHRSACRSIRCTRPAPRSPSSSDCSCFVPAWCAAARRSRTRVLPEEVVSVLGRVPLAARQFAELVRVGNKLVLVSITPTGAEPLTEITDPAEIDRLVGLCRQRTKGSSTDEFDQVFRQLAEETAPAGFLGDEVPRIDARLAAAAPTCSPPTGRCPTVRSRIAQTA